MTEIRLEFRIGDVVDKLESIRSAMDDPSPLMADVLLLQLRSVQNRFDAQGTSFGRWAELAESTNRARARKLSGGGKSKKKIAQLIGGMQILRDTGHLLQSVGGGASGPFAAQGGVGESDKDSATIQTSNAGAWNQFENMRTGAPARLIFLWEDQDVDDVKAMAMDFMMRVNAYAD